MDIHILQGERELVEDCRSLARFQLSGIPARPAGAARVKVTFQIDADGILKVSAEEVSTGTRQEVQVQPSHGLTDAQVEEMLQASLDFAEADVNARFLRTAVIEGKRVLAAIEPALNSDADLLRDGEADAIGDIVRSLKASMDGDDHRKIQDLTEMLDKVSSGFAHRRMERALNDGLRNVDLDRLEQELENQTKRWSMSSMDGRTRARRVTLRCAP